MESRADGWVARYQKGCTDRLAMDWMAGPGGWLAGWRWRSRVKRGPVACLTMVWGDRCFMGRQGGGSTTAGRAEPTTCPAAVQGNSSSRPVRTTMYFIINNVQTRASRRPALVHETVLHRALGLEAPAPAP